MKETQNEVFGPSPLLQPFSGLMMVVIEGIGSGYRNFGSDSTLFSYVGMVLAEWATDLRHVAVYASPDDFEIITFSPETRLLHVRMLWHWEWDGWDDYNRVPGLPDLTHLGEDDDEYLDYLCDVEDVDPSEIKEAVSEFLDHGPNLN